MTANRSILGDPIDVDVTRNPQTARPKDRLDSGILLPPLLLLGPLRRGTQGSGDVLDAGMNSGPSSIPDRFPRYPRPTAARERPTGKGVSIRGRSMPSTVATRRQFGNIKTPYYKLVFLNPFASRVLRIKGPCRACLGFVVVLSSPHA